LAGHTKMAATNFTPISLYYSTTASTAPTAGNLVAGELAINTADGKLFYKDSSGVVQTLATKGGVNGTSTGQVLFNSSGAIGGSNNLFWDITNGNLGIGTATPSGFLGNKLVIATGGTANEGMTIYSSSNNGSIWFAKATTGTGRYQGGIDYQHSTDKLYFYSATQGNMVLDSSGNLGIGTSSPSHKLTVTDTGTAYIVSKGASGQAAYLTACSNANTVGTSSFDFIQSADGSGNIYVRQAQPMIFATNNTERMRIASNGIVTMSAYGAGAATFSAAGVISSVSDETWKIKDGVPVNPDAMLQKLEPGYWFYNEEKSPIFGADRQLGFYAQNVHKAIGNEAAPTPEEGKPWGYYDRSVLAVAVMSLKNALSTIEELKQRVATLEAK